MTEAEVLGLDCLLVDEIDIHKVLLMGTFRSYMSWLQTDPGA